MFCYLILVYVSASSIDNTLLAQLLWPSLDRGPELRRGYTQTML